MNKVQLDKVDKVEIIKAGRDTKGMFVKGNKLQVSKKPITKEILERAINFFYQGFI